LEHRRKRAKSPIRSGERKTIDSEVKLKFQKGDASHHCSGGERQKKESENPESRGCQVPVV